MDQLLGVIKKALVRLVVVQENQSAWAPVFTSAVHRIKRSFDSWN